MLDFDNQAFTAVLGHLPDRTACEQGLFSRALAGRELTGVEDEFLHGSLDRVAARAPCPHVPSDELVGLRSRYVYSASGAYRHVYLNPTSTPGNACAAPSEGWPIPTAATATRGRTPVPVRLAREDRCRPSAYC